MNDVMKWVEKGATACHITPKSFGYPSSCHVFQSFTAQHTFCGCRDFDITEIDITESDVTETDITENDITESHITESDIT